MSLQSMIDESNNKIKSLMDARDEIMDGATLYFEVGSQSGNLPFSDELVEAFEHMIDEKTKKHRELVELIQKTYKLAGELDLDTC